jgi:hypothetical protein
MIIIIIQVTLLVALIAFALHSQHRAGRIRIENELYLKQKKYHWNPLTFRYELEPHQLEALSFKEITAPEAYDVMSTIEFNTSGMYKDKVKLMLREIGHDLKYRYIAKIPPLQNDT